MDLIKRLKSLSRLESIPEKELQWLVEKGEFGVYEVGSIIGPKGQRIDKLFIIFTGKIAIRVDRGVGPKLVAVWREGEVTGMLPYSRMKGPPGDNYIDEKVSLGNFVLTGGELAAACLVDSVSRLVPGVVGKDESVQDESFSEYNKKTKEFNIEYPQYTRPEVFKGHKVPKILLSGHHGEIKKWRDQQTKFRA